MQCPDCEGTGKQGGRLYQDGGQWIPVTPQGAADCDLCAGSGDYMRDWSPCEHKRKVEGFAAGTLYCKDCPAKIVRDFDGSERVVST